MRRESINPRRRAGRGVPHDPPVVLRHQLESCVRATSTRGPRSTGACRSCASALSADIAGTTPLLRPANRPRSRPVRVTHATAATSWHRAWAHPRGVRGGSRPSASPPRAPAATRRTFLPPSASAGTGRRQRLRGTPATRSSATYPVTWTRLVKAMSIDQRRKRRQAGGLADEHEMGIGSCGDERRQRRRIGSMRFSERDVAEGNEYGRRVAQSRNWRRTVSRPSDGNSSRVSDAGTPMRIVSTRRSGYCFA